MIEQLNKKQKERFFIILFVTIFVSICSFVAALMFGKYGTFSVPETFSMFFNSFGANFETEPYQQKVFQYIRLPRTLASFIIGCALACSGLVYQNTFNNKLVSPDILGVNSGCCVGAGIALLLGWNQFFVSLFAFVCGAAAVIISIALPKMFRNTSSLALVLSGIIVGAFMNSVISLLKYIADKNDKLSEITFWMMGAVSGTTMQEIYYTLPIIVISVSVLLFMRWKIDVIALGEEEASSLGVNYKRNRLIVILFATLLTAAAVSICGNVGWVGLVIPHIARALAGHSVRYSFPITILCGGTFMVLVDMLSRLISSNELPLSVVTGFLGAVIYTIVLVKKGKAIDD